MLIFYGGGTAGEWGSREELGGGGGGGKGVQGSRWIAGRFGAALELRSVAFDSAGGFLCTMRATATRARWQDPEAGVQARLDRCLRSFRLVDSVNM